MTVAPQERPTDLHLVDRSLTLVDSSAAEIRQKKAPQAYSKHSLGQEPRTHELWSKLLASPLITPIVVPYTIPHITPLLRSLDSSSGRHPSEKASGLPTLQEESIIHVSQKVRPGAPSRQEVSCRIKLDS